MADYLSVIQPNADLTIADFDGTTVGPGASTSLATGDIRRKYNFGSRVSELQIPQDPFFRFVSKVGKKPTDDPQFKYSEKRPSFHKRYAYCIGWVNNSGVDKHDDATFLAANDGGTPVAGDTVKLHMATDYAYQGNLQNVFGQTNNKYDVGATGTRPRFFLPGQLIKVPTNPTTYTVASWGSSYLLARIDAVATSDADSKESVLLTCTVVKAGGAELSGWSGTEFGPGAATGGDEAVSDVSIASQLEKARSHVVGSAHQEGSGYPETWIDQPYSSQYGVTQIWKTSMAMTNTARATSLKYESSEWGRVWREKLIEHKWDIETSLLFGSQYEDSTGGINYTQGAVDYITNYGNTFGLNTTSKTSDDFLDDMSNYLDPRYNNAGATMFFCNTRVYNWMNKLGGYFLNNMKLGDTGVESAGGVSRFNGDIAMTARTKVFGVDITKFSTPYGDMNVARNIHLDGTNVEMLGINMKNCSYRPLVGNGLNRDTSVYVGVQTLENSGVDRRVDLILTEAGMEWSMAESHAIWTSNA
jgi:hypothetical protein